VIRNDSYLTYGVQTIDISSWSYYNGTQEKFYYAPFSTGLYLIRVEDPDHNGMFITNRLNGQNETTSHIVQPNGEDGNYETVETVSYSPVKNYALGRPGAQEIIQPDRRFNDSDYKANTNWYIPAHTYVKDYYTESLSGYSATRTRVTGTVTLTAHELNPVTYVNSIDTSVQSSDPCGILKITLLRNGLREIYQVFLYAETRTCSKNQQ
jgi:hypothetical protein